MESNISKTVIRIIQDYCFNNSASVLNNEFVSTVSPLIIKALADGTFDPAKMKSVAKQRADFFHANDLDINIFCKGLFSKLNYELKFYTNISFYSSIVEFKRKMENGNFHGFPKKTTSEDTLRSTLSLFISQETFCESRSGAGNNDIVVPSEKTIIETKLWNGVEYYNAGFPELNEYLDKSAYSEGYYIIFDYNQSLNEIIKENGEIFDAKYQGKIIHIFFIRMNAVRPSKIYKQSKASN
ncbi:MAG: hypothetical protein KBS74_08590 [Clostridiales bacterium]|nr:hypothetical protein [Candidatus Cacconaster stercorequi]